MKVPRVLMITGGYDPEFAGGVRQAQELARYLSGRVDFTVLTLTASSRLPAVDEVDRTRVYRVRVRMGSAVSQATAAARLAARFYALRSEFDIVHVHGHSRKMLLVAPLARLLRKPLLLTLQTGGHDDAVEIRKRSRLEFRAYASADLVTAVSPGLADSCRAAGLPESKLLLIPNSVDVDKFRPAVAGEQRALRDELALPLDRRLVLFTAAFFTPEKCPDVLFEAWARLPQALRAGTALVLIGATKLPYFETDADLAREIRARAEALGVADDLHFVERTSSIEKFYRAADVFVLPSVREGLPKTLLEAMATGLPCIATNLRGSTDTIVRDGADGLLVPPRDVAALSDALGRVLRDPAYASDLGIAARRAVEARYASARIVPQYLAAYRRLAGLPDEGAAADARAVAAR